MTKYSRQCHHYITLVHVGDLVDSYTGFIHFYHVLLNINLDSNKYFQSTFDVILPLMCSFALLFRHENFSWPSIKSFLIGSFYEIFLVCTSDWMPSKKINSQLFSFFSGTFLIFMNTEIALRTSSLTAFAISKHSKIAITSASYFKPGPTIPQENVRDWLSLIVFLINCSTKQTCLQI